MVVCDVSEEPTASIFRLNIFEEDGQEIGREERFAYTGRTVVILVFQSCDWPRFFQTLLYSLLFPSLYFAHLNQSDST